MQFASGKIYTEFTFNTHSHPDLVASDWTHQRQDRIGAPKLARSAYHIRFGACQPQRRLIRDIDASHFGLSRAVIGRFRSYIYG